MVNVITTAAELGYIQIPDNTLIDIEQLGNYPPESTVLITTGSQGDVYKRQVMTRRVNKRFPMESMEVNAELGGRILDQFPNMKVDVHHPDVILHVELRHCLLYTSRCV